MAATTWLTATGDHLLLLNNDTEVTDDTTTSAGLDGDRSIGGLSKSGFSLLRRAYSVRGLRP